MTKTKNQSLADFVWPEFNSDKERIKAYSKRYKNMSIKDAFEHTYGIKINSTKESVNDVPKPLVVGDRVNLNVLNINKSKVEFDIGNYKTPITSAVNLNKYKRFKNNSLSGKSTLHKLKIFYSSNHRFTNNSLYILILENWR